MPELEPKSFYDELFRQTKAAYEQSDIKNKNDRWKFDICAGPIVKGRGVIMGLNWGAEKGEEYLEPIAYPSKAAGDDFKFIIRSMNYLTAYFGVSSIEMVNYTNPCFFRSYKISEISVKDWKLTLPLLEMYLRYVNPPWIVLLGTSCVPMLRTHNHICELETFGKLWGTRTAYRYKGYLFEIPFLCFPHPQSRIPRKVRDELWEGATKGIKR